MALTCQHCQTELVPQANYCHQCGRRVVSGASGRRLDVIRTTIVVAAVVSIIGWFALFAEVETVLASGPILLLSGITLIIACLPIRYRRGSLLGLLHCGICALFALLVSAFNLSPHDARVPFISLGLLYLVGAIPLSIAAYRDAPVRHDPSRCAKCGYLLFGLTSARCPECGTPFDPESVTAPPDGATHPRREGSA